MEVIGFELLEKPILRMFNLQGEELITIYLQNSKESVSFNERINNGIYILEISDESQGVFFRKKLIGGAWFIIPKQWFWIVPKRGFFFW